MSTVDLIAKDEAIAALRGAAWIEDVVESCGHRGCEEHPVAEKLRIHSFAGGLGADWDLDEAEAVVARADQVGWSDHLLRHDLAVLVDGRVYRFDVRRPDAHS